MNFQKVVTLLHCCFFRLLVQSAPVQTGGPAFQSATEHARILVEKILRDIPAMHRAAVNTEGLTLDPSSHPTNLEMMMTSLGIPAAPVLRPLSKHFTLNICVNRMSDGIRLHQELLGALHADVSKLRDIQTDLRDLNTHISKIKELAQLGTSMEQYHSPDLASRLHGNYEVQVAVHLTLQQLRSFCHDMIRSLRHISTYRPTGGATP